MDEYTRPLLEPLERFLRGEDPCIGLDKSEPLSRDSELRRPPGTSSAQPGSEARNRDVRPSEEPLDASGGAARGMSLPKLLLDAARNTLGVLDQVIDATDPTDLDWSGRVLVVAPDGVASNRLLVRYGAKDVEHAILLVPRSVDTYWWHAFADWPRCLLTQRAAGGLPGDLSSVFCVSSDEAIQERFGMHFGPLGSFRPDRAQRGRQR